MSVLKAVAVEARLRIAALLCPHLKPLHVQQGAVILYVCIHACLPVFVSNPEPKSGDCWLFISSQPFPVLLQHVL